MEITLDDAKAVLKEFEFSNAAAFVDTFEGKAESLQHALNKHFRLIDEPTHTVVKRTSARLSTKASSFMRITKDELAEQIVNEPDELVRQIRAMAASLMSQDTIRGQDHG